MPEILGRLRPPRLAGAPASPANGEMYYDSGTNILYWWNGTAWVSASGGSGGHTIQDEGSALPARTGLNFVGAGVTATDDSANNRTNVNVAPPSTMAARMYRTAAFTTTAGNAVKIPLDTIDFDTSGMASTAGGRINVSVSGYYEISATVGTLPAATGDSYLSVFVNGAERIHGNRLQTANWTIPVASDMLRLNAGDYVELYVYTATAQALVIYSARDCVLSVALLSSLSGAVGPVTAARATRTSQALVALTASTWTKLPLDSISSDAGNNYNTTSQRYTCPATGAYDVTANANINFGATGGTVQLSIYKNGFQFASTVVYCPSNGTVAPSVSDIAQCNAGDYFEVYVNPAVAGASYQWNGNVNFLSVAQVGNLSATPASTACARMYRAAAWTMPGAAQQKVPLDAITYDTSGMVQLASNRIVAPVAGYYDISAGIELAGTSPAWVDGFVMVFRNGSEIMRGSRHNEATGNTAQDHMSVASDKIQCNAGDYLELYVYCDRAAPATTGAAPYLSVALLTPLSGTAGPVTAARAYRNAAFSTAASTTAKVPLDTVSYDPGGNFSLASNRYICPATGFYQVQATLALGNGPAGQYSMAIYKNGAAVAWGDEISPAINTRPYLTVSDIVSCNAGDYLELYYWATQVCGLDTAAPTDSKTMMSVVQVGNSMNFTAASGDLTGKYPNPTVQTVRGGLVPTALRPVASGVDYVAQAFDFVVCSAVINVSIPAAPPSGTVVGVQAGGGRVAIWRSGSDSIVRNNAVYTSLWLNNGGTLMLVYTGGNGWRVVSDTDPGPGSCYARRYHSPAWGPTTGSTWYALGWDTNDGGDTSRWDGSGRYVCPVDGQFTVRAHWTMGSAADAEIRLACGRSSQERSVSVGTKALIANTSILLEGTMLCNAGEALTVWAYTNPGGFSKTAPVANYADNYCEVWRVA